MFFHSIFIQNLVRMLYSSIFKTIIDSFFKKYDQFSMFVKDSIVVGTTLSIKEKKVQNNNFEILYCTCRSSTPLLSSAFNSSNMLLSIPKGQHGKM